MNKTKKIFLFGGMTFFFIFFAGYTLSRFHQNSEIYFFETFRGDSIYIQTKSGSDIVIDGGLTNLVISKIYSKKPFWDKKIDLLILSHPDSDHIGGAYEVLQRFDVQYVLMAGIKKDSQYYQNIFDILQEKQIPFSFGTKDTDFVFGETFFDTLFPKYISSGAEYKNTNNGGLVVQMREKNFSLLLTGDIEKETEKTLLEEGIMLESDILKVPHHGSKSSSSEEFLKAVSPKMTLFCVGKGNTFGHPHSESIEKYKNMNIPFLITKNGDISVEVLEKEFCVEQKDFKKCFAS